MSLMQAPMEISGIFRRWIIKTLRRPTFLFFSLIQPIIWFFLFTQAFQSVADIPGFESMTGTGSYLTFFTAAVVLQTVMASALQSGIGMVEDLESGYMDKMKASPINRFSILMGKVLSDGFRIVIQTFIIVLLALIAGVSFATGALGVLVILLLAAIFSIVWSGISTFVALATKNSESTLMISLLTTFPLLFLSTAVMPKPLLPEWVQMFSDINPISYMADAIRELIITGFDFNGILTAVLVTVLVGAVTLGATTAMFRRTLSR